MLHVQKVQLKCLSIRVGGRFSQRWLQFLATPSIAYLSVIRLRVSTMFEPLWIIWLVCEETVPVDFFALGARNIWDKEVQKDSITKGVRENFWRKFELR